MVFIDLIIFLRLLEDSKIPKSCFLSKMTRLNRHCFQKLVWSPGKLTQCGRDASCVT